MPKRKTQFIAGGLVAATVSFIIQSAEMAMDNHLQKRFGNSW